MPNNVPTGPGFLAGTLLGGALVALLPPRAGRALAAGFTGFMLGAAIAVELGIRPGSKGSKGSKSLPFDLPDSNVRFMEFDSPEAMNDFVKKVFGPQGEKDDTPPSSGQYL